MRTPEEKQALRERATELRLAGKSLREIKQILGPAGKPMLHGAHRDRPPAEWTKRPSATDNLRAEAGELRLQGLARNEIAAQSQRRTEGRPCAVAGSAAAPRRTTGR